MNQIRWPVRWVAVMAGLLVSAAAGVMAGPIDRAALVGRHAVGLTNFDAGNPLSVGNGEFAFTADATGLHDRGEIAPGKRADMLRVALHDGEPVVRAVWREGRRVA